jgi:hypothetical protein
MTGNGVSDIGKHPFKRKHMRIDAMHQRKSVRRNAPQQRVVIAIERRDLLGRKGRANPAKCLHPTAPFLAYEQSSRSSL